MLNVFHQAKSQISPQILETGINVLVAERDSHLAEMERLTEIITDASVALKQHSRLYEALNNALFTINHPFDDAAAKTLETDMTDAIDADLSVDQPSDEERQAAFETLPPHLKASHPFPPTAKEIGFAEPLTKYEGPLPPTAEEYAALDAAKRGDFCEVPIRSRKRKLA